MEMAELMKQRLAKRLRGYDFYINAMLENFVSAFNERSTTVYVSGYAFPLELLWAFDVVPFDFEIACNNLPEATAGQGSSIMRFAEDAGYNRDICAFDRLIIGCDIKGMLPKGEIYLTSSYYCHGKAKANEIVAARAGKKSILFEVPNQISHGSIQYVVSQLKGIAKTLEDVAGQKLDMDRLKESIKSSNRARSSLLKINALMKTKPCPWDGARASLLSLGGIFWGSPVQEQIFNLLHKEITDRVQNKTALPENLRVLWFPWVPVQQTNYFDIFKEHQVSIPMVESAYVWWDELDEDHPFETLALKALNNYMVGSAQRRAAGLSKIAGEYDVNGAIHFSTPACYHENGGFRIISDALKKVNVPVLNLEGDMTDERNYFPEQAYAKLNTFIEVMQEKAYGPKDASET